MTTNAMAAQDSMVISRKQAAAVIRTTVPAKARHTLILSLGGPFTGRPAHPIRVIHDEVWLLLWRSALQ